jgi:hypothetical protein
MQAFQKIEDHLAGPEVEVSGRFVGEQNRRFSHQSPRQHHALLFSSG